MPLARFWSFDRRITGGFIVIALIAFTTSFVALLASRALLPAVGDAGLERTRGLEAALHLQEAVKIKLSNAQAFLLTGREPYLTEARRAQDDLVARISRLGLEAESEHARALIDRIRVLEIDHNAALNQAIELRQREGTPEAIVRIYGREVVSRQESLEGAIDNYVAYRKNLLTSAQSNAHRELESTESWITAVAVVGLLLFLAIVLALRGTLLNLYRAESNQRRAEAVAREAAEQLVESQAYSEETTRLVVESALDAVISMDAQAHVTGWNREAERIFGWSAEEMRGHSLHDRVIAAADRERFLDGLGGDAGREETLLDHRVEMKAVRRNGEEFPIELALTQIRRPNVHYSAFVRDITDRRRVEDQREELLVIERAARSAAEHASSMKDEFLATLSHELRTPLQAMLGWSRLLGAERLDEAQLKHGMEIIERNVTLQKRLIEDLLDMSRIVQGKMQLDARRIRLKDVVEAALEVVRPAADAKSIQLALELDARISTVHGDAQRLQQVVWNLLSNAIKFTPSGGRILVRLVRLPEYVRISVEDSGIGISPEFLPHVFERFRQEDASATRRHGGLGLGLAIVRTLVELHGGRVQATSAGEGRGATFTIELPSARPQSSSPGVAAPADGQADAMREKASEPSLNGLRIVVVDDERDTCDLLCRVLSARGAECFEAHSVDEALAAYDRIQPNMVVSDIGMPGRDGYDLMRGIREMERGDGGRVAAIALTAFARPEDAARAMRAGFDLHLAKPVEPAELAAAVAKLAAPSPLSS
jgi:PAS domain S-box-containing protein